MFDQILGANSRNLAIGLLFTAMLIGATAGALSR